MSGAIGIFAKTIGLSSVKTRLAADIGVKNAEAFYALSVDCVQEAILAAQDAASDAVAVTWTVAEEAGPPKWQSRPFDAVWTGETSNVRFS